jgi:hypothetical protein
MTPTGEVSVLGGTALASAPFSAPGIQECMSGPLPLAEDFAVNGFSPFCGRLGAFRTKLVDGLCWAVDALRTASASAILSAGSGDGGALPRAKAEVRARYGGAVVRLGPVPSPEARSLALAALLKQDDVYRLDSVSASSVRPYVADNVRIIRDGAVSPKSLSAVVGPEGQKYVDAPGKWILRSLQDLAKLGDENFVVPYTDPLLRRRSVMKSLVDKLFKAGVITFRRKCRCKVGVFFRGKERWHVTSCC